MIEFRDVSQQYEAEKPIIRHLSLTVSQGEFVVLIGPSGCGKTTLLKMMNGLIQPDSGEIRIKGKELKAWDPITLKRNFGYVIQQVGLFPHLTIEKNIAYALDIQKASEALAADPEIILMDEPLGAVDQIKRGGFRMRLFGFIKPSIKPLSLSPTTSRKPSSWGPKSW